MNYACLNGKWIDAAAPALLVANRSYRYGDGIFETIKCWKEKILLADYHFDRLFAGLRLLRYDIPTLFTPAQLAGTIDTLCRKNKCTKAARVRLSIFRGNGGLYDSDQQLHYLIECWPLPTQVNLLNENGWVLGLLEEAAKTRDAISNLKTSSALLYSLGAQVAKENKWNECLVQNTEHRIADATITNVFCIRGNTIHTPPLSEGGVAGVMRQYLLDQLAATQQPVEETPLTFNDLLEADEVFLTNAIQGIRWAKELGQRKYGNAKTIDLYHRYIKPMLA